MTKWKWDLSHIFHENKNSTSLRVSQLARNVGLTRVQRGDTLSCRKLAALQFLLPLRRRRRVSTRGEQLSHAVSRRSNNFLRRIHIFLQDIPIVSHKFARATWMFYTALLLCNPKNLKPHTPKSIRRKITNSVCARYPTVENCWLFPRHLVYTLYCKTPLYSFSYREIYPTTTDNFPIYTLSLFSRNKISGREAFSSRQERKVERSLSHAIRVEGESDPSVIRARGRTRKHVEPEMRARARARLRPTQ